MTMDQANSVLGQLASQCSRAIASDHPFSARPAFLCVSTQRRWAPLAGLAEHWQHATVRLDQSGRSTIVLTLLEKLAESKSIQVPQLILPVGS